MASQVLNQGQARQPPERRKDLIYIQTACPSTVPAIYALIPLPGNQTGKSGLFFSGQIDRCALRYNYDLLSLCSGLFSEPGVRCAPPLRELISVQGGGVAGSAVKYNPIPGRPVAVRGPPLCLEDCSGCHSGQRVIFHARALPDPGEGDGRNADAFQEARARRYDD